MCAEAPRAAGAPVETRDMGSDTILHKAGSAASTSGDVSPIDTALSWGISKNAQSVDGRTALHKAVEINNDKVIKALLDRRFDLYIKNIVG